MLQLLLGITASGNIPQDYLFHTQLLLNFIPSNVNSVNNFAGLSAIDQIISTNNLDI